MKLLKVEEKMAYEAYYKQQKGLYKSKYHSIPPSERRKYIKFSWNLLPKETKARFLAVQNPNDT